MCQIKVSESAITVNQLVNKLLVNKLLVVVGSYACAEVFNMSRMRRSSPPPQLDAHREKAMRSIFVANISFETTEEEMRAVLSEVHTSIET